MRVPRRGQEGGSRRPIPGIRGMTGEDLRDDHEPDRVDSFPLTVQMTDLPCADAKGELAAPPRSRFYSGPVGYLFGYLLARRSRLGHRSSDATTSINVQVKCGAAIRAPPAAAGRG